MQTARSVCRLLFSLIAGGMLYSGNALAGWQIGAAKVDITGNILHSPLMGYVNEKQVSRGLHSRLYARTFVLAVSHDGDRPAPVAIVSAELSNISYALKYEVLRILRQEEESDIFDFDNVLLSATHTHAAPAGADVHGLFNLYLGQNRLRLQQLARDIATSIRQAYADLQPGQIHFAESLVENAGTNRSAPAFRKNKNHQAVPPTDKRMRLLRFTAADGRQIGSINWFAVHATGMNRENRLISSDNKGYAAWLVEQTQAGIHAFANEREGDVSPLPNNRTSPLPDQELVAIQGKKQASVANGMLAGAAAGSRQFTEVAARLDVQHVFIDVSRAGLCKPAIGYAVLAGAEDGPGELKGFFEGMRARDLRGFREKAVEFTLKNILSDRVTSEDRSCHGSKPIISLFDFENSLAPRLIALQTIQIGPLLIAAFPQEVTTTAGFRLEQALLQNRPQVKDVIIASLSNGFAGYLATPEEYSVQHYEGAFTLYGPRTLSVYLNKLLPANLQTTGSLQADELNNQQARDHFAKLAAMPDDLPAALRSVGQRAWRDNKVNFQLDYARSGEIITEPATHYQIGDFVTARLIMSDLNNLPAGNRDDHGHNDIIQLQKWHGAGWQVVATEASPQIRLDFRHDDILTVTAQTDLLITPGTYRFLFYAKFPRPWLTEPELLPVHSRAFALQ